MMPIEAIALLEIDGLPRAIAAQDAALKRAPVHVFAATPVSDGKAILIFGADVASVEESLAAAETIVGSRRLDRLFLPGVHPAVVRALFGERLQRKGRSVAILELKSVAAALEAADGAAKAAEVEVGRLHPATGFGGRAFFSLHGELSALEAAIERAAALAKERLLDREIIAAPHEELDGSAFVRPWPIDPSDPPNR